ncbi:hypothetical protein NQ317_016601 [Molorchus minor]|uniref:Uncharacterized protein n=1 Tax=Molorchus minor TaxID=1323400 RepID=A0ABQ9J4R6_9CUCU|nr:hypothetical protein NQ317_016601 [Molorchus minor]
MIPRVINNIPKLVEIGEISCHSQKTNGERLSDNHTAPRRRRRQRKQPKTVVNPDSNFYFYWLLVLTICILYNLWTLIVRQSFPELQITCDFGVQTQS